MSSPKQIHRKKFLKNEKRLEKKHGRIFIGLCVFACLYYLFIEPFYIGHDIRYTIFVFWLPVTLGVVALAIYRWPFLLLRLQEERNYLMRLLLVLFWLVQGLITPYLSAGQVSKITWDILNETAVQKSVTTMMRCDIKKISTAKNGAHIYFIFNGKQENLKVSYSDVAAYLHENPKNYRLFVKVKAGYWNHYKVDEWEIIQK